jgi:hypothetical protein
MSSVPDVLRLSSLLGLSLLAVGCGGGGDKPKLVDAHLLQDSGPVECLLPASLGTVTPTMQDAHSAMSAMATMPDNFYLYADLDADPSPDILLIDLYAGYGAFMAGLPTAPAMIDISGAETSYDTCGACLLAQTDLDTAAMTFTGDPYFATAGTLQLTSVSPTSIAGTLTNITFTHATIDPDTSATTPLGDGCSSTLASLAFSAVPVPDPAVNGRIRLGIAVPKRARQ